MKIYMYFSKKNTCILLCKACVFLPSTHRIHELYVRNYFLDLLVTYE